MSLAAFFQHPIYSAPSSSKTEVVLACSKITLLYNKRFFFLFCYFVDFCSIHHNNFISLPTIMVALFIVLTVCLTIHYSSGFETKGLAQNNIQDSKLHFLLNIYYLEFYQSLWLTISILFKSYDAFLHFKSLKLI